MTVQPLQPSNAPRKELVNRLQKNALALLVVFALAFIGLYVLMNITVDKRSADKEKLNQSIRVVQNIESHWLEWLLMEEKERYTKAVLSPDYYHQILESEYHLLELKIDGFDVNFDKDLYLSFLSELNSEKAASGLLASHEREAIYTLFSELERLDKALLKIGVDLDYEQQILSVRFLWVSVVFFLLISVLVIWMAVRFNRQLNSGLSSLHYILDHHKHGHGILIAPRDMADEFTDLVHLFDHELISRESEMIQRNDSLNMIESSLHKINEAFFITDNEGHVIWMSSGAEMLWSKNTELFKSMLGIDSELDSPIGESVLPSFLRKQKEVSVSLKDGVYNLDVHPLVASGESDVSSLQCFISFNLKSEVAELQVLHHSLKLMEGDVWDIPIRPLRDGSPYESFALSLESVRLRVSELLKVIDENIEFVPEFGKITKLQQITSLIDEKNTQNNATENDLIVPDDFVRNVKDGLNNVISLSDQIRDSLLLGYESALQRLTLIEKDLSSDVYLLEDVDRCLNEVRAAVLSSLSAAEGESEDVKQRFSIDVEHDVSSVQSQVGKMKVLASSTLSLLETDQNIGASRLNRANMSLDDLVDKVSGLLGQISDGSMNPDHTQEKE